MRLPLSSRESLAYVARTPVRGVTPTAQKGGAVPLGAEGHRPFTEGPFRSGYLVMWFSHVG